MGLLSGRLGAFNKKTNRFENKSAGNRVSTPIVGIEELEIEGFR
jgi:hypothetical protein